eukprot:6938911-Alexandrium_andersonii.AAC.1
MDRSRWRRCLKCSKIGADRFGGPKDDRADSSVEQGESISGLGVHTDQDMGEAPEGLPSSC